MALITDIAYEAPFVSLSFNRALGVLHGHGVVQGFGVDAVGGVVTAHAGAAIVYRDGVGLLVHSTGGEDVTPPLVEDTYYIVLEAQYINLGDEANPDFPPGGSTTATVKWILAADLEPYHVILATIYVPAAAVQIETEYIWLNDRHLSPSHADVHHGLRVFELGQTESATRGSACSIKNSGKVELAQRLYAFDYTQAPRDDAGGDFPHTTGGTHPQDDQVLDVFSLNDPSKEYFCIVTRDSGGDSNRYVRIIRAKGLQLWEGEAGTAISDDDEFDAPVGAGIQTAVAGLRCVVAHRTPTDEYPALEAFDFDEAALTLIGEGGRYQIEAQAAKEMGVCALDTDKALAVWVRQATGELCACVCTVSAGRAITFGATVVLQSDAGAAMPVALTSTEAVVAFTDTAAGSGRSQALTVAGTTITPSAASTFYAASEPSRIAVDASSDEDFVLLWQAGGTNGTALVATGSLVAGAFSFSASAEHNSDSVSIPKHGVRVVGGVALVGSNRQTAKPCLGWLILSSLSLSDNTTLGSATDLLGGLALMAGGSLLAPIGTGLQADIHRITTKLTEDRRDGWSGIFFDDAPTGGMVRVVLKGSVSDLHSGLDAGKDYYIDLGGSLTRDNTGHRAGQAISGTSIILKD